MQDDPNDSTRWPRPSCCSRPSGRCCPRARAGARRGGARRPLRGPGAAGRSGGAAPARAAAGAAAATADARFRRHAPPPDAEFRQGAGVRRTVGNLPPHLGAARRQPRPAQPVPERQARRAGGAARRLHHGVRRRHARQRRPAKRSTAATAGSRAALRAGQDLPRRRHPPCAGAGRRRSASCAPARAAVASVAGGGDTRSVQRRDAARAPRGCAPRPARCSRCTSTSTWPRWNVRWWRAASARCSTCTRPARSARRRCWRTARCSRPPRCCCLRDSGSAVAINPVASPWKGNAVAPTELLATLGVRLGMGTDGTRSDGFRMMDAAETNQRLAFGLASGDSVCGGGRLWLDIGNARQRRRGRPGRADRRGGHRPAADFLLIDLDVPEMTPSWDLRWELVRLASRAQIESVHVPVGCGCGKAGRLTGTRARCSPRCAKSRRSASRARRSTRCTARASA